MVEGSRQTKAVGRRSARGARKVPHCAPQAGLPFLQNLASSYLPSLHKLKKSRLAQRWHGVEAGKAIRLKRLRFGHISPEGRLVHVIEQGGNRCASSFGYGQKPNIVSAPCPRRFLSRPTHPERHATYARVFYYLSAPKTKRTGLDAWRIRSASSRQTAVRGWCAPSFPGSGKKYRPPSRDHPKQTLALVHWDASGYQSFQQETLRSACQLPPLARPGCAPAGWLFLTPYRPHQTRQQSQILIWGRHKRRGSGSRAADLTMLELYASQLCFVSRKG